MLDWGSVLFGIPRMLLTPQPWSIVPEYEFLIPSAVVNWLMFPATIGGLLFLWKRGTVAWLMILYAMLSVVVYGAFPDLQGPRHRIQFTPMLFWMQFHFLYVVVKSFLKLGKKESIQTHPALKSSEVSIRV
jgi:hypothetical protein